MADLDDDSTFVTIGTPFQPLEEDVNGDNKIVYARDRKPGETFRERKERQRFHGAFTGGFSAGYYNTVGSEEGWRPSSFQSSRRGTSEKESKKPEDFMDSEDFGRYGIAPRRVAPTKDFSLDSLKSGDEMGLLLGNKRSHAASTGSVLSEMFGGNFLKDLVVSTRSSIGVTLLKRMGWKEGQGIGPKTHRKTLVSKGPAKAYGCSLPSREGAQGNDGYMLAPGDVKPWVLTPKDDFHGIAYSGIVEEKVEGMRGKNRSSHLYGVFGQAFGIGALEEEEEEDGDVYAKDTLADYSHSTVVEGEVEREDKFGWTGPHSTGVWSLDAFVKSKKALKLQRAYPPPTLPKGYSPKQPLFLGSTNIREDPSHRHRLTAAARGHLIGEITSALSLVPPQDRARMEQARASSVSRAKQNRWDQPGQVASGDRTSKNLTEWETRKEKTGPLSLAALQEQMGKTFTSKFAKEGEMENQGNSSSATNVPTISQAETTDHSEKHNARPVREVLEWHPHRVLCKRLDVPDPYPNSRLVGLVNQRNKATKVDQFVKEAITLQWTPESTDKSPGASTGASTTVDMALETGGGLLPGPTITAVSRPEAKQSRLSDPDRDSSTVLKEDGQNSMETGQTGSSLEQEERPPMDIFKAIFADSDDSDSSSDSETNDDDDEVETAATTNDVVGGSRPDNDTSVDGRGEYSKQRDTDIARTSSLPSDERLPWSGIGPSPELQSTAVPLTVQSSSANLKSISSRLSVPTRGSGRIVLPEDGNGRERETRNGEGPSASSLIDAEGIDSGARSPALAKDPVPCMYGPALPPSFDRAESSGSGSEMSAETGHRLNHRHQHKKKDRKKSGRKDKTHKTHKKHKKHKHKAL